MPERIGHSMLSSSPTRDWQSGKQGFVTATESWSERGGLHVVHFGVVTGLVIEWRPKGEKNWRVSTESVTNHPALYTKEEASRYKKDFERVNPGEVFRIVRCKNRRWRNDIRSGTGHGHPVRMTYLT